MAIKVEGWHRRHALHMASQLPENRVDALAVLECLKELLDGFLDPARAFSRPEEAQERPFCVGYNLRPRSKLSVLRSP